MKRNESTIDRLGRAIVAVAAVVGAMATTGVWSIVLWVVAAIMAVTAVAGFCPLYTLFRINTCKVSK
ncbi:DUF2892 domain-containing protein [Corynebacterium choanae]|uniref:Inner membrane protein YgaP-like transmembrane domain-containing protein n=1 Tax=Corynebacterium choanae TaxID=1862358 RepID=A0A3G6J7X9_9CORY|nr:DUF2892 domain-containing protein [Corynebacterium choanae]AZA14221.1 hypothetical protein CCHOA_09190 [Corynebacterium choanae]